MTDDDRSLAALLARFPRAGRVERCVGARLLPGAGHSMISERWAEVLNASTA
jgi:hypothetical protein